MSRIPSKGVYAKDKYGKPIKDPSKSNKKMKYSELLALQQGQNANAANGNGTTQTTSAAGATSTNGAPAAKSSLEGKPFNPDFRGASDTVNTALYGTTTLVNDHSKVYKGGSWNDLAFWLNPSTRRFMNEDEASAEVGFRCAMTMVGAPEIHPQGKPHYSVKAPKNYKPQ